MLGLPVRQACIMSLYRDFEQALAEPGKVQTLWCVRKKMRILPESIGFLGQLEKLSLAHNPLDALPESLARLSHLKQLNLSYNRFTSFPLPLLRLENLNSLDLRHNRLVQLPPQISQMRALRHLNLRGNPINRLPDSLAELDQLESLCLAQTQPLDWEGVVEILKKMPQLQSLDLSHTQLSALPDNFFQIQSLRHLNLSHNPELNLEDAFEQLARMPQLVSLDLRHTQDHLPENLVHIQSLQSLAYHRLQADAQHIAQLPHLKELIAEQGQLTRLPDWIMEIKQLERLHLRHNQIQQLPDNFGQLTQLRYLDLRHNQLQSLPEVLAHQLHQFDELALEGNRDLPARPIRRLLKFCREAQLSPEEKSLAACLWNGPPPHLIPSQCALVWWKLLHQHLPLLNRALLAWIDAHSPTEVNLPPPGTQIWLAGFSRRFGIREAQAILKKCHIRLYPPHEPPSRPDIIVLGDRPGPWSDFPAHFEGEWRSDAYLQALIEKISPSPQLPKKSVQKLLSLLNSPDSSHLRLALQMLKGGGLPDYLRESVVILYVFGRETSLRQGARYFIQKYFSNHLLARLPFWEEMGEESVLQELMQEPGLDAQRLANFAYRYARLGQKLVLALGGSAFEELIKEKINYQGVLSLRFNFRTISPQLRHLNYVDKIEIIGSVYHKTSLETMPSVLFEMPQLELLRIDDTHLAHLPSEIARLPRLNNLRLANNRLKDLPESLGQLSKLQILSLFNNRIAQLPESLGQLTELRELWLFANQLKDLPVSIGDLSQLERLHLSSNQLQSLPPELGKLSNLKELSLSGNPIRHFPESLACLQSLRFLDVRRNSYLDHRQRFWLQKQLPNCSIQF
ncbi:MAG: hypothetical protein OHK0053_31810 [Microscillaceae bacterium]